MTAASTSVKKKQRRAKSFRGCTYCRYGFAPGMLLTFRANKKKCSEGGIALCLILICVERPACAYCVKTGHASTCKAYTLRSCSDTVV